jgi:ATP-dependent Clp protease ATP-binding subunit ClpA
MRLLLRRRPQPRYVHRTTPFIDAAARMSRGLGHNYVGTEHLLLALAADRQTRAAQTLDELGLSPDEIRADIVALIGIAENPATRLDADALATLGIDLDEVRRRVEEVFGPNALERTRAGCTPVVPRLKKALELAAREAGEGPVDAHHVLIGVASVENSVAAQILARHGITADELRASAR